MRAAGLRVFAATLVLVVGLGLTGCGRLGNRDPAPADDPASTSAPADGVDAVLGDLDAVDAAIAGAGDDAAAGDTAASTDDAP